MEAARPEIAKSPYNLPAIRSLETFRRILSGTGKAAIFRIAFLG
jgi:hypothetical protein